jgi:hypothetical protein
MKNNCHCRECGRGRTKEAQSFIDKTKPPASNRSKGAFYFRGWGNAERFRISGKGYVYWLNQMGYRVCEYQHCYGHNESGSYNMSFILKTNQDKYVFCRIDGDYGHSDMEKIDDIFKGIGSGKRKYGVKKLSELDKENKKWIKEREPFDYVETNKKGWADFEIKDISSDHIRLEKIRGVHA